VAKADAVHFDGADDPRDLQEMRSQLVEHKLAYKGQVQCIKKFDGSKTMEAPLTRPLVMLRVMGRSRQTERMLFIGASRCNSRLPDRGQVGHWNRHSWRSPPIIHKVCPCSQR